MNVIHEKILSLDYISKSFSGTKALREVSFDLHTGEVHCLVGENGAGKSTLIKILSGAEKPDRGDIVLYGHTFPYLTPGEAIRQGIATIYQDVDLVTTLTVADNMFLGSEIITPLGFVNSRKQEELARQTMEQLNIDINPRVLVEELSHAQMQTLQIVKALHHEAKILIMDEPTASLGKEEATALMAMIRTLTAKGIGIIYISHHLHEVFEIGDRITVLKDGRKVRTYQREEGSSDLIVRDMVGREASLYYQREAVPIREVALQVRNYRRGKVVKDVSFEVRKGEVFGIGGLVGAGRTELVNLLFGVDKRDAGTLLLNGADITPTSPRQAIARGLCLIVEDRKESGLFLSRPVKENIAIIRNEQQLFLRGEKQDVGRMIQALSIHLKSMTQEVASLSGGNQQKSVLARWLLSDASVFIFDEPTKGVDIGAKEEIYKFMTSLAGQGKSLIMVSSDLPELLSMSDRIGIMRGGEMTKIIPAAHATEQGLMSEFLGLAEAA